MSIARFNNIFVKILMINLLWLSTATIGNSQLVKLNLSLSRDSIQIGERVLLHLEINKQSRVRLQPLSLTDSLDKEIEIIDSLMVISGDSIIFNLHLTSFVAGRYLIPSVPFVFNYENNTDTIFSQGILLTVVSPVIDSQAGIRDIKPPLNLPFRLIEIIPGTGIAIGIITVLIVLVIFFVRHLRKKNEFEKTEIIQPPHVIALRELDVLKGEKLWQQGKIKEYHSRLADIMRIYLENRFNIPAMEYVSTETLISFRKLFPHEEILDEMLKSILQTSDMVKFAKADPLPIDNQGNMNNAYLFIKQTRIEDNPPVSSDTENIENLSVNEKINN